MNKNSWYHSHSFKFCGLTWEFTYIEATASRTIQTTKADGTKINLTIPIKETTKFPYPLAWLKKWEQSNGKRMLLREKAEPGTLFDLTPSKLQQGETEKTLLGVNGEKEAQLTPSKLQQGETEKTLLGVNGEKEVQLTPSKSQQGETEKTLLGVNEKEEVQLTPSKLQQGETEKTLLGVNGEKEVQLTPSKCLSCSLCERISPILLTCLASPKYFTEEAANGCDRFTKQEQAQSEAEEIKEIPKRPRRRRGSGSGTFITTYANHGKYGKKYPQISYQVEFAGKKRSIYLIPEKIKKIQKLDRQGLPISEILEAIDSPKARKILKEYKDFMESKEEKI
jgi:formate hydrogenlyase subunit 6/NADH:ubiquinone oxidoreductase subunit I